MVSANRHSFLNAIYAEEALGKSAKDKTWFGQFIDDQTNQKKVNQFAKKRGFIEIKDNTGATYMHKL
ncbi:MAG: hypothetical protein CM15mP83_1320 [Flavobacteriaceae bacterium]|nr:MAG: hypothetical protein CM15mP83_1320 [Flavobacteriaceae bacterium]